MRRSDLEMAMAFSESGGGMGRPIQLQTRFAHTRQVLHTMALADASSHACRRQLLRTVTHAETPNHACCRQVLRAVAHVEATSHACCSWTKGDATMSMGCLCLPVSPPEVSGYRWLDGG